MRSQSWGAGPRRTRAAVLLIMVAALCCTLPASALAAPAAPFSHSGRWLSDAGGRTMILHGVNMVYKLPPYAPDASGFDEDDAAFLAAEGYDTVRLGVIWKAVEPEPGRYDDAYLARIKTTVDLLERHGILSVLDFHQDLYNERFQGEGAPDWAVLDDGLPAQPQLGFPGNYLGMPALQRAFDHFWDNDPGPGGVGLQDRYAGAWAHVAAFFKGNPGVLGHELFNEPWPGTTWQSCVNTAGCPIFEGKLTRFTQRVTAAIRAVDPGVLVFYEPHPFFNNGSNTALGPIGDPHAVFAFHDYCLSATNTNSDDGCAPFDDLVFANAEARSRATGDALMLTEFGSTDAPDVLTNMAERADRTMIGWHYWSYCACAAPTDTGGETAGLVRDPEKPPSGENIKPAKLKLLSRPHPRAISGVLSSFGWDGTTFRAAWKPSATASNPVSELALPARQFPDGYGARVEGGSIASAPGAAVLRVAACPGASSVSVVVSAKDRASTASCATAAAAGSRRFGLRLRIRHARLKAGRRVRVSVTVTHRTTRRGVRRARVQVGPVVGRADARGRVRMRVRVGPRGLTLRVTAKGASARRVALKLGSRR